MRILTKEGCNQCQKVMEYLDSKNIDYEVINLSKKEERENRKHYRDSGYRLLPVVENNGWAIEGLNIKLLEEYING